ncbi:hypothetical protein [Vibrio scophthalmi]|uniref:Uncharacterized protein n=1 Tax=Vibrio scophthalmi TaxID=45658 RepID=A0A1C7FFC9_9VIBR|nr:hypothetical protein [Vibrio scophthalmi]ANU38710.1 hypothetical protein VSVS05_03673 [Vibrio scophthalmi]
MNEYQKKMMIYRFQLAVYYMKPLAKLLLLAFICSTAYVAYTDDVSIVTAMGVVKENFIDGAEWTYNSGFNVISDFLWHTGITKTYEFESSAF